MALDVGQLGMPAGPVQTEAAIMGSVGELWSVASAERLPPPQEEWPARGRCELGQRSVALTGSSTFSTLCRPPQPRGHRPCQHAPLRGSQNSRWNSNGGRSHRPRALLALVFAHSPHGFCFFGVSRGQERFGSQQHLVWRRGAR